MLSPLSRLYELGIRVRNRSFDRGERVERVEARVVSVGNLTAGGTGKTPLVAWLARVLSERELHPSIVTRGYGGRAGAGPLWVSRGDGPLCDAATCGDEPYLLACSLRGVPIVAGADRVAGALAAVAAGARIIVLDDGFQHRRLARDVDLVLLDGRDPFGNGKLIPAGSLREPLTSLGRADVVIVTRSSAEARHPEIEAVVRRHNTEASLLRAGHRATGWVDLRGETSPAPVRAVGFCGIGSPGSFRRDLEKQDLELVHFTAFADHHTYRPRELVQLRQVAAERGAWLATTEKDLARLTDATELADGPPLVALRIEALPYEAEALLESVVAEIQ